MTEADKVRAWIEKTTQIVEQRIHRSVVAFEQGLPQPVEPGLQLGALCEQLGQAHQMLGRLTISTFRTR